MLAAGAVGALGMAQLLFAGDTLEEVNALNGALSTIQDVETSNSDVTGWQASYAWDTRRLGGMAAVADDNANRAGFLDSAERLRGHLAAMPTEVLTETERTTFATIEQQWEAYFEVDDQVVETYAMNTPDALEAGDALILGPGWDVYFEVFTLTGELRQSLEDRVESATVAAQAAESRAQWVMATAIALGLLAALGLALGVSRRIVRPLNSVVEVATALAAGDLTRTTGVQRSDEVGRAALAIDAAVAELRTVLGTVASSADAVAASSEELSASSAQISAGAEETSAQSGVVSGAAEEVSRSVQTVAAGAEQMGASIREIASNAAEASEVAARAVTAAETTTATVAKLGESSAEIGNVVKV
ncbi:methyl-accepting chemotaxis protein, partial [Blastococcus sp. MG754426]|nr:methyl-accepting chemotaxis protein [Blastococcus sp. MG754426]MCF6514503.1 methyl-accepting chemotaxis protein [Blastococcus sp. MG754427]